MIKSNIADVADLGSPAGHAGSSTAAECLQRFANKDTGSGENVSKTPWAHLDIAGVVDTTKGGISKESSV